MKYEGYTAVINYSDEDKAFHSKVAGIRALLSLEGDSVEELEKAFHKSIEEYLYDCKKEGKSPINE
jgi:predicted HicB family RNase H-like nuclease